MIAFWLLALGAAVLAVVLVLVPLRSRRAAMSPERRTVNVELHTQRQAELARDTAAGLLDEPTADALRVDLERQLLADGERGGNLPARGPDPDGRGDRHLLWIIAAMVPLIAVAVYLPRGALPEMALAETMAAINQLPPGPAGVDDLRRLTSQLETRLQAAPEAPGGWLLLGRAAFSVRNYPLAVRAFETLVVLVPDALAARVYLLQARYLADGQQLTPRVQQAADAVLQRDPEESITLEILAMGAVQQERYADAIELIERALAAGVNPDRTAFLRQGLEAATGRLRDTAGAAAITDAGPWIDVTLSASAAVRARFPATTAVFLLARPVGGHMPLAVVRRSLADLPLVVRLSGRQAMAPAATLGTVATVEIRARLAPSGTTERTPDDVEVVAGPVATDSGAEVALQLGATASGAAGDSPQAVRVRVEIAPDMVDMVPAGGADLPVFVFAREVGGSAIPLAVARVPLRELPGVVTLDANSAMIEGRTIALADAIEIVARVSLSGDARPASGDLEGRSGVLQVAAIDAEVPVLISGRRP